MNIGRGADALEPARFRIEAEESGSTSVIRLITQLTFVAA